MEVLEEGPSEWAGELECWRCGTKVRADQDDLQVDGFKTAGLHFAGTAVIENKFFVECPADKSVMFVDWEEVPTLLRDRLRKGMKR